MGLLNKLFKSERAEPDSGPVSGTRFQESDDPDDDAAEREAARRELVQLTLRDTMRRHAVPSDWIECRMLPVVNSKRRSGLHVQFVVKQGQASLLTYIPSFQSSLMAEIEKFDPRAWDWLLSISWQFAGITAKSGGALPEGGAWHKEGAQGTAPAALAGTAGVDDDVAEDLQALFAIRDAAMKEAPSGPDFEATRPGFLPSGGGPGR
ncbi:MULTISPECIES: hypothetical protein [Ramlibacter]|uniref:Uncharacterized protein n=1 Tax=Ramlibacter pinisoli TaxID=2682844 RepID=A0A6N8IZ17_9BURK|nr:MULTISPECIES: hypothetical protein [Ramlibacter]MBA2961346.1 hypothetical protein [Ramlibacter sp. CGMCC 1.13660]MVQ31290.1 hypothetical protein [Ramlibacter pinisoli]